MACVQARHIYRGYRDEVHGGLHPQFSHPSAPLLHLMERKQDASGSMGQQRNGPFLPLGVLYLPGVTYTTYTLPSRDLHLRKLRWVA